MATDALRDKNQNVSGRLKRLLSQASLSPADRGLARELTMGVVRTRGALDAVINAYLNQPNKKVPMPVRNILRVALYQILYLDRIPTFAAIDEAVNQTKQFHKRQSGMVNGLLRSVDREIARVDIDPAAMPPEPDVVTTSQNQAWKFPKAIFPDPQSDPAEYVAAAWSMSLPLAQKWAERFDPQQLMRIARGTCCTPPLTLRVNTLKATMQQALDGFQAAGISASVHNNGKSIVLNSGDLFGKLPDFAAGFYQPQDPTATAVVADMDLQPGMRVLDFCAAPGTKTTHMAERMQNEGTVIAADVDEYKIEKISSNAQRLGIDIITTMLAEQVGQLDPGSFDIVLADAPCSNTGVLARRPEAKWRFEADTIGPVVNTQQQILDMASIFVKPGGQLVYSICSIEPEEGPHVAKSFAQRSGMKLCGEKPTLPAGADNPQAWCDGGYVATFKK
ncbi:MAG: methyltransferase domain-containing protein [Phycisphaerae bacterium]|nr:methyltransferase domain-containing protein [Phycisphaerae bacterium]